MEIVAPNISRPLAFPEELTPDTSESAQVQEGGSLHEARRAQAAEDGTPTDDRPLLQDPGEQQSATGGATLRPNLLRQSIFEAIVPGRPPAQAHSLYEA